MSRHDLVKITPVENDLQNSYFLSVFKEKEVQIFRFIIKIQFLD